MNMRAFFLAVGLFALPGLAWSWWNDDWGSRKPIGLDGSVTGADLKESVGEFPLLLRLHTGNFGYFAELAEGGKDLRFMADDKTPLKFHVEKFDAINEMALVWVKVPRFQGGIDTDTLWMYYGNGEAPAASEPGGTYDVGQALVYHFDEANPLPTDATAYANNATAPAPGVEPAGWIGAAARFAGNGAIQVNPSPSLRLDPAQGWTFTAWLRIDQPQEATVLRAGEGANALELVVKGQGLVGRYTNAGKTVETAPAALQPGKWQHVALVLRPGALEVYLDGNPAGSTPAAAGPLNPAVSLGGGAGGGFLTGALDEVGIANTARGAEWVKLLMRSQSPDFTVINLGQDESKQGAGGEVNSFLVIIQNVTVDGWVVIGLTGVMFVVAVMVMITKGFIVSRIKKDNKAFLEKYEALSTESDMGALDHEETEEDKEVGDSEFLSALVGHHDHFQSSTLYHIYHAGIREVRKRAGSTITPEALNVIKVKLDSAVVREAQRLNSKMVLLTIAIAGGPFLGLLGTVVGVMITFAVIAATGDVNINSIAPGIAAALLATVAGLAVAIPALFAYNYLLTQIKDIVADMRVFTDEFIADLSERIADHQRG
jgi:biopolymer transport protein ExbB